MSDIAIDRDLEEFYHLDTITYEGRMHQMIEHLPDIFEFDKVYTILDAGCSKGLTTVELSQIFQNSKIVGIDLVNKFIDFQNNPNISFQQNDMYLPNFPKESIDIVFMANNALHIINKMFSFCYEGSFFTDEIISLLKPSINVLKTGGKLVLYCDFDGPFSLSGLSRLFRLSFLIIEKTEQGVVLCGSDEFYKKFSFSVNNTRTLVSRLNSE